MSFFNFLAMQYCSTIECLPCWKKKFNYIC